MSTCEGKHAADDHVYGERELRWDRPNSGEKTNSGEEKKKKGGGGRATDPSIVVKELVALCAVQALYCFRGPFCFACVVGFSRFGLNSNLALPVASGQ